MQGATSAPPRRGTLRNTLLAEVCEARRWAFLLAMDVPAVAAFEGRHGLSSRDLETGEGVLHHWSAPRGLGVVTNRRVLLLGHPAPLHRHVEWCQDLESVKVIEVERMQDTVLLEDPKWSTPQAAPVGGPSYAEGIGLSKVSVPSNFHVVVDGTSVFHGYPMHCERVQGWIEEARWARMQDLGRAPRS